MVMAVDLKDVHRKVEEIVSLQTEALNSYKKGQKERLANLRALIEGISIENLSDDHLEDALEGINDVLYDSTDAFEAQIYAHEHRNKVMMTVEEWQSSHC